MLKDKMGVINGIHSISWVLIFWCTFGRLASAPRYTENDFCQFDTYSGTCLAASKCTDLSNNMRDMGLEITDVEYCGFTFTEEMICCPEKTSEEEVNEYDDEKEEEATDHDDELDIRNVGQQITFFPILLKEKYGEATEYDHERKGLFFSEYDDEKEEEATEHDDELDIRNVGQQITFLPILLKEKYGEATEYDHERKEEATEYDDEKEEEATDHDDELDIRNVGQQITFLPIFPKEKYVGDQCQFSGHGGICTEESRCVDLPVEMKKRGLGPNDVVRCGFTPYEEIICCPQASSSSAISSLTVQPQFGDHPAGKVGDQCQFSGHEGICTEESRCVDLPVEMKKRGLGPNDVVRCGFTPYEEIICCPQASSSSAISSLTVQPQFGDHPAGKVGDQCQFSGHEGICTEESRCVDLPVEMKKRGLGPNDVVRCGFTPYEEIICCPQASSSSAISSLTVQPQFGDHPAGKVGDQCQFSGHEGTCTEQSKCVNLPNEMKKLGLAQRDIVRCGFTSYEEIICCPLTLSGTGTDTRYTGRVAAIACDEIEKQVQPAVVRHIHGGRSVELGEYPHMVAIGLQNGPSIIYNCGGTLIAKRFVLTAAHCLVHQQKPVKVRMGVVDFSNDDEMKHATEINIKKSHLHPKYNKDTQYNDIALLELESDAPYTNNIYPTCLYFRPTDLPKNEEYYVSGWGVTNNNRKSKILLTANLTILENKRCNASYAEVGLNRRIPSGVIGSQLCAHDVDGKKNVCPGDSGGPLFMKVGKASGKFRVVGIVSLGNSCGDSLPALYTRVSAFMDFIESTVWPKAAMDL